MGTVAGKSTPIAPTIILGNPSNNSKQINSHQPDSDKKKAVSETVNKNEVPETLIKNL